jgi:putative RecB family exonuclease
MYEASPLKYKLRHIDKIPVPEVEGVEAFLGIRVHEALEKLYNDLSYSKLLTLGELLSYYNAEWDKHWSNAVVIRKKDYSSQNYRDTGIRCLKGYYEKYQPFDKATTIGTELKLDFSLTVPLYPPLQKGGEGGFEVSFPHFSKELPLTKNNKYKMTGYIDRLDKLPGGLYEIHDYKTSNSLLSQEDFDNDRQLALYEIGIRKSYTDIKEVKLKWHYLAFDTEMSSQRTPEQLEDLRKRMIALIDTIEADKEFKHRESALCGWCEYTEYCPARKHKSNPR